MTKHKNQLLVDDLKDLIQQYDYDEYKTLAEYLALFYHVGDYNKDANHAKLFDFIDNEIMIPKTGRGGGTINDLTKHIYDFLGGYRADK